MAQTAGGNIGGKSLMADGNAVSGVTVTLTSAASKTDKPKSAVTNEIGSYVFENEPAGSYELKFEKAGYTTVTKQVKVEPNTPLDVNATMETKK
jgi:hypothetical protein